MTKDRNANSIYLRESIKKAGFKEKDLGASAAEKRMLREDEEFNDI